MNNYKNLSPKISIIKTNYYKIIANENIKKGEIILIEKPLYQETDIIKLLYEILKNKEDSDIISLYPRKNIVILKLKSFYV